jgi:enoyl-[acyl-carrier protein] reductase II
MIRTPVCDLLDIQYPIVMGGMAWIGTAEFAAAVSNAGGMGMIGSATMPKEELRQEIQKIRTLTDKTFGVNLVPLDHDHSRLRARVEACCEEEVPVVSTAFSDPKRPIVTLLRDNGVKVMGVVPSVRLGRRMEDEGANVIIASGCEAGGHVGKISTLPMVPQMVDSVNVPVLAAGGIADARGFVAALALGAQGVSLGTRFLATVECPVHDSVKEKLIAADDESTTVTGKISGTTMRVLKNRLTEEWFAREEAGATAEEMANFGLGKYRSGLFDGDIDFGSLPASQSCALLKEVMTVKEVIDTIIDEAIQIYRSMSAYIPVSTEA